MSRAIAARALLFTACAVPLAGLAGCRVNEAEQVGKYRKVLDSADATPTQYVAGQPVTLEHALLLANQHNENLAVRGEDYLQALYAKDRAFGAFLPTISLGPTYSRSDQGSSSSDTSGSSSSRNGRLDVPVNGNSNLFRGFSDVAAFRSAGATIEERRALLLNAQATILLEVAQTYYEVLRSEASVRVLENSLRVQGERLRDIRARQRVGTARPLDVAQIEAQESVARVGLIQARNNVANGRTTLAFLVGAPVSDAALVDDFAPPDDINPISAYVEEAAGFRADLLAAQASINAARFNVNTQVGRYYPSVTLNLNYYLSRQSAPTDSDWNALLSANLPIFTGGVIEADVKTAWSQLRQAKLNESLTRRQVEQDIQTAHQNLLAARLRVTELRGQVGAAAEELRQAEESYKVGLATNLERVQAQDRLLAAQLLLTNAEFDAKIFYLDLLRAAGRLNTRTTATTVPATLPSTAPAAFPGGNAPASTGT